MTKAENKWREPKRTNGPSLTARGVANLLGFTSVESVHILVRTGPERGGLAGYIPAKDGIGWIRKTGPGHSGVEVMFYREDITAWEKEHPILEREKARVDYSPEEKARVLEETQRLKAETGHVVRTELMRRLAWNTRSYKKLKQILDDENIPLPPRQPRDTTARRKLHGMQNRQGFEFRAEAAS